MAVEEQVEYRVVPHIQIKLRSFRLPEGTPRPRPWWLPCRPLPHREAVGGAAAAVAPAAHPGDAKWASNSKGIIELNTNRFCCGHYCLFIGRLVDQYLIISFKGGKVHLNALIGALVFLPSRLLCLWLL